MKFKLDENLPVSSAAILAGAGHDIDTVGQEGLSGAAAVGKAVSDLAALTNADGLAGAVSVLQRGLLRIRHP